MQVHQASAEPWRVTLVDTGDDTHDRRTAQAGGVVSRRRAVLLHLRRRRQRHRRAQTVELSERDKGARDGDGRAAAGAFRRAESRPRDAWSAFEEKPRGDGSWINGGFFVLSPKVIDYIEGDTTSWESEPLRAPRARGPACRLSPRRFLAADGHAARQDTVSRTCGVPARRRGKSGREPALLAGAKSPGHRPHRIQGRMAGAVAPERWAPG